MVSRDRPALRRRRRREVGGVWRPSTMRVEIVGLGLQVGQQRRDVTGHRRTVAAVECTIIGCAGDDERRRDAVVGGRRADAGSTPARWTRRCC